MDADDTLLEEHRLARALGRKRESGCELAHFRTWGVTSVGEEKGELLWSAPPAQGELRGSAVFAVYAACPYPPLQLWGKIYSRVLLERVSPLTLGTKIFRFNDKFLVSLIILHAQSYLGCEEYIYRYRLCENWPLNKFAGRVHDLLTLREVIRPLLDKPDVAPEAARAFRRFLERRLTYNMGKLCIETEQRLFGGENPDMLFAEISPFLDDESLFFSALFSARHNVEAVSDIFLRIRDEF